MRVAARAVVPVQVVVPRVAAQAVAMRVDPVGAVVAVPVAAVEQVDPVQAVALVGRAVPRVAPQVAAVRVVRVAARGHRTQQVHRNPQQELNPQQWHQSGR